ncbi:scribbler isoform 2-T2 [Cochliomyia hominivorax]
MSSQSGNNGGTSSNIGGAGISNINSGQSISCSNNSNKPNNKMSIDHQATLDKGLKMKIKRTKPGTKSSEAKHEIVKASEQQNGLMGSGSSVCSLNQDDITCVISVSNQIASNSQNHNLTMGINSSQGNSNSAGSKKNLGSGNNQSNTSTSNNCGNVTLNNSGTSNNNSSQVNIQGSKRGSSGHRRDKTKEKSLHSNRLGTEKSSSVSTEKEPIEKSTCACVGTDSNISNCSCNRKTETNTLTQRLSTQNTNSNTSSVPPGVFTPSAETLNATAVSTLLTVSTAVSTPVSTQTISSSINANAPGPPCKDVSTNGGNIKISSHIAAQLAAAAASNTSSNGPSGSTTFLNTDMKSSSSNMQSQIVKQSTAGQTSASVHTTTCNNKTPTGPSLICTDNLITTSVSSNEMTESPPAKRVKHAGSIAAVSSVNKEMVDMCIGTSVGTITEPECLGPCEPGTSVTLEGIVWHETEGGVLVVNVTWRGKTYVGTLLDCTRHDWAPPRFCDSPTEELDARTPKGRGKRGRAAITPDLSNFTETRSSIYFSHSHVHSKLRNGSSKGGRGTSRATSAVVVDKISGASSLSSGNGGSTPSTSPTALLPPRAEKRKSKDESPPPLSRNNEPLTNNVVNAVGIPSSSIGGVANQPHSLINPVTGLNVQISTKKCKTSSPCAISPVLLECPEQDCSKKYKHVNGLRYHQSHAHGTASLLDEDSMAETEEHVTPLPSPLSSTSTPIIAPNSSDLILNTQMAISSQAENLENNLKKIDDENRSLPLDNSDEVPIPKVGKSLPDEDILTANESDTVAISSGTSSSENISSGTSHNEEQKQFQDLVVTSNQTTSESPTGKSGVLRFGQGEIKNKDTTLTTNIPNEKLPQIETNEDSNNTSSSPEKSIESQQELNKDTYCSENETHIHQNQKNIGSSKNVSNTLAAKSKKGRKSPSVNDFDDIEISACNMSSREDVQSPAYSDISDDSTPINEADNIDKENTSKTTDIIKKTQDIELSPSTCPSNPSNMSSSLGGYGVYQFYQQQKFIVPTSAEQQQSDKNPINSNSGSLIQPSLNQQQCVSEFNVKKDNTLELMSKGNSLHHLSNQHCQEVNKECTRPICVTNSQGNSELSNLPSVGPSALTSTTPSKSISHFYAFNYMPPNYPFSVDPNYGNSSVAAEDNKHNRLSERISPNDHSQHQHNPILFKEDRLKEDIISVDAAKSSNTQILSKPSTKSDSFVKSEGIKQEAQLTSISQIPQHMQIQTKEHQGIGVYQNVYPRHPLTLSSQQLSREEELRRYYIFSDQQRRQNNSSQNTISQQVQPTSQSGNQQSKDDSTISQSQNQQQIKIKSNISLNVNKSSNPVVSSKESPKHKAEEELKIIKQEGQKPTMETQGPPPPPTSQYFLHPSYITSTPFAFDPSHPMYRNVLLPTSSPYNTPPYHLPMPRYHAPEDLSRNTGTKALDALHHAASQYYTTHKIHELSERALKSPNNSNNVSSTIKISGSSPNIGSSQHSNICSNVLSNHSVTNQPASVTQLQHNLSSQSIAISNKSDVISQKTHGNNTGITGISHNDSQKTQVSVNSAPCGGNGSNNVGSNSNVVSTSDSRSPPPQRHVHTHHHTHVGLGYPMYPAPYGAAVLASQQAAAVAVINPFPPGPNK